MVAPHAGGVASVAIDRESALVEPERDAERLATVIDALLGDPGLRAAIGGAGRQRMQREHTWARVAQRFETAYDLAAAHARRRRV